MYIPVPVLLHIASTKYGSNECAYTCLRYSQDTQRLMSVIDSLFVYLSNIVCFSCLLLCVAMPLGGGCDLLATGEAEIEEKQQDTPVFEKHDNLLHGDTNKR